MGKKGKRAVEDVRTLSVTWAQRTLSASSMLSHSNINSQSLPVPNFSVLVNARARCSVGRSSHITQRDSLEIHGSPHPYQPSPLTINSTRIIDTYKGGSLLTQIGI